MVQSDKLRFAPQNLYPRPEPSIGIFCSAFAIFITLFLFLACDSSSYETQLNQAREYQTQGNLEVAEQLITEVIQKNENYHSFF